MLVKFLAHGTGSARKAADYFPGARDATGKPRDGVEVLAGTRTKWPPWPTRWRSSTSSRRGGSRGRRRTNRLTPHVPVSRIGILQHRVRYRDETTARLSERLARRQHETHHERPPDGSTPSPPHSSPVPADVRPASILHRRPTGRVTTGAGRRWPRPATGCPPTCARRCQRHARSSTVRSAGRPALAARSGARGRGCP